MYDLFAFEYGYSIDDFLDLTLTQMHNLSRAIDFRNTSRFHANAQFQASLQGAKIKPLEELMQATEEVAFDPKTDAQLEDYAIRRLRERQVGR